MPRKTVRKQGQPRVGAHPKWDYSPSGERVPWSYYNGPAQPQEGSIFRQQLSGGVHPAFTAARQATQGGMNPWMALMQAFQQYNGGQGGDSFFGLAPPKPQMTQEQLLAKNPGAARFFMPRPGPYQGSPLQASAPMIPDSTPDLSQLPPALKQFTG